jgi:hypothetical protein
MSTGSTSVQGQDSPEPALTQETKSIAIRSVNKASTPDKVTGSTTGTEEQKQRQQHTGDTTNCPMTQNIWIFIFRGYPEDTYNRRHTLFYLDSPDVDDFHITAHAQQPTEKLPYEYVEVDGEERYPMSIDLINGRLVGRAQVDHQRKLLDVIASTPVGGEPDWNCQHFVFNALDRLTEAGAISRQQLDDAKDWMMDSVLDGAIA